MLSNGKMIPFNSMLKNNDIFFVDNMFYSCILTPKLNF